MSFINSFFLVNMLTETEEEYVHDCFECLRKNIEEKMNRIDLHHQLGLTPKTGINTPFGVSTHPLPPPKRGY